MNSVLSNLGNAWGLAKQNAGSTWKGVKSGSITFKLQVEISRLHSTIERIQKQMGIDIFDHILANDQEKVMEIFECAKLKINLINLQIEEKTQQILDLTKNKDENETINDIQATANEEKIEKAEDAIQDIEMNEVVNEVKNSYKDANGKTKVSDSSLIENTMNSKENCVEVYESTK